METPYNLRVSPKSRNVYLRMSLEGGLQIVVPRGYDLTRIPALIERKQRWIDRTRQRLAHYKSNAALKPIEKFPSQIILTAINETWAVEYVPSNSPSVHLREASDYRLIISGHVTSEVACKRVLRQWLCQRGWATLIPWLRTVSQEINLPFEKASVRLQKSRWGSCSRRKTISVNAKLLFLRPELVRYLFVHELSHLVHMNHSARYWNFVGRNEPRYRELDREMRTAMRTIPRWL